MTDSRCCRLQRTNHEGGATRAGELPGDGAEEGYALLAVLVAVFLVLLALSVAAPTVIRALRRDRELEAVHRADQYVRAIQLYYRKFGHYPASLDQLEKSNNLRFLRQRYPDPFTGKPDWRLIKVGENKTSVKGFFGQPLAGVNSAGLGSVAGMSSGIGSTPTAAGASTGTTTGSGTTGTDTMSGTSATGAGSTDGAGTGSGFGASSSSSTGSTGATSGSPGTSTSATSFSGTGAPFVGVGLPKAGSSILTVNEKMTYPEWEFLYDPRIEQLRSKSNLLGGGGTASGASSLGTAAGSSSFGSSMSGAGSSSTPSSTTGSSATTPQ